MEKHKKNQSPPSSDRNYQDQDRRNNPANPKTGPGSQKSSTTDDDNARMRFENEYEGTNDQDKREESDRKIVGNQPSQAVNKNPTQNYKPNSPNTNFNEGLNQGSKQSKGQITNKKGQITNKGINQDTESINK